MVITRVSFQLMVSVLVSISRGVLTVVLLPELFSVGLIFSESKQSKF